MLDGVERDPHTGVTDGVDVDLEPVGVEDANGLLQPFGGPVRQPARVRRVLVWLQQEARSRLDHTVGEELHRAGGQPGGRDVVGLEGALALRETRCADESTSRDRP